MQEKEYILKILDRVEEIKPSEFVKWESFKRFGLPRIRAFVNGEEFKEKVDIASEAEKVFEIR